MTITALTTLLSLIEPLPADRCVELRTTEPYARVTLRLSFEVRRSGSGARERFVEVEVWDGPSCDGNRLSRVRQKLLEPRESAVTLRGVSLNVPTDGSGRAYLKFRHDRFGKATATYTIDQLSSAVK